MHFTKVAWVIINVDSPDNWSDINLFNEWTSNRTDCSIIWKEVVGDGLLLFLFTISYNDLPFDSCILKLIESFL